MLRGDLYKKLHVIAIEKIFNIIEFNDDFGQRIYSTKTRVGSSTDP